MPIKALCLFAALIVSTAAAASPGHTDRPDTRLNPSDIVFDSNPQWDTPPELLSGRLPIYPISQVLARKEGVATIQYTIGADGIPKNVMVQSASDRRFGNHAVIAVRAWKFRPATKGASPTEATVRETFTYDPRTHYGAVTVSQEAGFEEAR